MTITSPVKAFVRAKATTVQVLLTIALALAGILLFSDLPNLPNQLHAYLSSLPLAIAGIGYATLQLLRRPPLGTMLKRLLLAATFVLWAIDQLLPAGRVATFIGDVVITAYILDLYWLIQEQVTSADSTASR
jgi:hypothetical protein